MDRNYELEVFADITELSKAAADFVLQVAKASVERSGSFTIAISGGSTPEKLYELLGRTPYNESMPWQYTHFFWSDERCVPLKDTRNNAYNAKSSLLDKVNIPAQQVHRIQTDLPPKEAAATYENELQAVWKGNTPKFDLILLGMGDDGHTASLFPGTPVLNDSSLLVKEVYLPEQSMHRVTMTARLINKAHNILFLVSGRNKSKVLREVLTNENAQTLLPAQLIKPVTGHLFWFVDADAASSL